LIGHLEHICRVVHPEGENLKSFGHEIRNVLILACTEVKMHWKSVLEANGESGESTKDYVKLAKAMRLADYEVDFTYYPWFQALKPFEKWGSSSNTTQDIEWYDAYNGVKHNRDSNFSRGTLQRAFEAIATCFIMLCAQYGWDFALRGDAAAKHITPYRCASMHPSEVYIPPYEGELKTKYYAF